MTWRFQLRPGARWQDGAPLTSEDVRFSFEVFSDTAVGSAAAPSLTGNVEVIPEDSATFLVRFARPYPEQLYDATYHVRVIPKHVWGSVPRDAWATDTGTARMIGSGPYRLQRWERGQFLVLVADSTAGDDQPEIRRAVWRFTSDPDAALNLVLSHEADLLETAIGPERAARAAEDSSLRVISYPSAAYGFLGFNFSNRRRGGPHPILADRRLAAVSRWGWTAACWPARCSARRRRRRRVRCHACSGSGATRSARCRSTPAPLEDAGRRGVEAAGRRAGAPPREPAAGVRYSRAEHERFAPAARGAVAGDVAAARRGGDGDAGGLPGLPGASGDRSVRQLHRRVAGRADAAGTGGSVGPRGMGGDQLRTLRECGVRLAAGGGGAGVVGAAGVGALSPGDGHAERGRAGDLLYAPAHTAVASRRMGKVEIDPYSWASGMREWEVQKVK